MYEDRNDVTSGTSNDDEEIEEIRELMYDLLKDFPTGATSKLLEEQYDKRYVQTGMGRPLPTQWIRYVQQAEEFEIKQLSTVTMIYLVSAESLAVVDSPIMSTALAYSNMTLSNTSEISQIDSVESDEKLKPIADINNEECQENVPPAKFIAPPEEYHLEAMELITLPTNICVDAYITFGTDPDNIFVRLCAWDPALDYMYSTLMSMPKTERDPPPIKNMHAGQFFTAPINGVWERVRLVRKSDKFPTYWIVFVVDVGYYNIIAQSALRQSSEAVKAFTKIFLARIKLAGISPNKTSIPSINGSRTSNVAKNESVQWSREAQYFMSNMLTPQYSSALQKVELLPEGEWTLDTELKIPVTSAKIMIEGVDISAQFISMGFAKRK